MQHKLFGFILLLEPKKVLLVRYFHRLTFPQTLRPLDKLRLCNLASVLVFLDDLRRLQGFLSVLQFLLFVLCELVKNAFIERVLHSQFLITFDSLPDDSKPLIETLVRV